MQEPIRQLSLSQFRVLLDNVFLRRRIVEVHLHHTWRPTKSQFRGLRTVEAMRRFHVETKGWSDIAQHLTIDPQGGLWTGRPWDRPPASAKGHNGSTESGPFMIEMVGDFDHGADCLDGEQRRAVIEVVAALLHRFELGVGNLRFHNEFSNKSCPGTSVDQETLQTEVSAALEGLGEADARERRGIGPFSARFLQGFGVTTPLSRDTQPVDDDELDETDPGPWGEDGALAEETSRGISRGGWRRGDDLPALEKDDLCTLRHHVVNMEMGRLAHEDDEDVGRFRTTSGDLRRLRRDLGTWCEERAAEGETPRVLVWAHGGLVNEEMALRTALRDRDFWLANGIYPIFFVWETGAFEILEQRRSRGRLGDWILERSLRPLARRLWSGMKESAELASRADFGDGEGGGVYQTTQILRELVLERGKEEQSVEVHAVGHSAGSILLSHMVEVLDRPADDKLHLETLAFLAPAARVDLFQNKVLPRVGSRKVVKRFSLFTMNKDLELADTVKWIYRKSLLYFVSRACEPDDKAKILGLQTSLDQSPDVMALLRKKSADVIWSRTQEPHGHAACEADTHGGFDEDPATMDAVALRILGDHTSPHPPTFHPGERPAERRRRALADVAASEPLAESFGAAPAPASPAMTDSGGQRTALCIGIDTYAQAALEGCVADAKLWARELEGLGFGVSSLHDQQASREGMLESIEREVRDARSGDIVVIQYSGHGSQVPDLNGDETEKPYDETLVPHDYLHEGMIVDDELGAIWDRVSDGVALFLFMDCCHSGTNSRFAPVHRTRGAGLKARFLAPPDEVLEIHRARGAAPRSGRRTRSVPPETHFAACLDSQYAYEENGQGYFTRSAAPLLAEAVRRGTSPQQFLVQIRSRMPGHLHQDPQLTGRTDGRLLAPRVTAAPGAPPPASSRDLDAFLRDLQSLLASYRQTR